MLEVFGSVGKKCTFIVSMKDGARNFTISCEVDFSYKGVSHILIFFISRLPNSLEECRKIV